MRLKGKQFIEFSMLLFALIILAGIVSIWALSGTLRLDVLHKGKNTEETSQTTIAFETLGAGAFLTGDMGSHTIIIVGNKKEADNLATVLGSDTIEAEIGKKLLEIDFKNTLVIGVVRATTPTSGYDITIQGIRKNAGSIEVAVDLSDPRSPDPDSGGINIAPAAIANSYHIVLVPKQVIALQRGTTWKLVTADGNLLTQTDYP